MRRRFPSYLVEQVIRSLLEQDLLDDSKFASLWKESRNAHRPRSAAAIKHELISRGISRDVAEASVHDIDDQDSAYRAGLKVSRRLNADDFPLFRRKLWGYLQRRGFSGSVTRRIISRLWDELEESPSRPGDDAEVC